MPELSRIARETNIKIHATHSENIAGSAFSKVPASTGTLRGFQNHIYRAGRMFSIKRTIVVYKMFTLMEKQMNALYTTSVTATGGRHGQIRSEDGLLNMKLALPRELGGRGDATNPETLFAGGYAACFENALLRVSREQGLKFADEDVEVTAQIGLSRNEEGNFVLSASLSIALRGVNQQKAEDLVKAAHKICPYSNAIRGNVDVGFTISIHPTA
jgi:osmotically inducible protein OsmC